MKLNKICQKDNIEFLKELPSESVDLCYIDPPFFTQRDWGEFNDKWKDLTSFIHGFMVPRIKQIHRVLKDTGVFCLHCDWRTSHYLKVNCDVIFGYKNFRNEVIWHGAVGDTSSKNKKFIKSHDTIFFYGKSKHNKWNDVFQDYSSGGIAAYKYEDENGKFQWAPCDNPGGGGYSYDLGFDEKQPKNGYRMPKETALKWMKEGKLKVEKEKVPRVKKYIGKGVRCKDVWADINSTQGSEFLGYPTQKPEALLERIIKAFTNKGDTVLDCFMGSGTTLSVAKRLGRNYLGCDISEKSYKITRDRLSKIL